MCRGVRNEEAGRPSRVPLLRAGPPLVLRKAGCLSTRAYPDVVRGMPRGHPASVRGPTAGFWSRPIAARRARKAYTAWRRSNSGAALAGTARLSRGLQPWRPVPPMGSPKLANAPCRNTNVHPDPWRSRAAAQTLSQLAWSCLQKRVAETHPYEIAVTPSQRRDASRLPMVQEGAGSPATRGSVELALASYTCVGAFERDVHRPAAFVSCRYSRATLPR